jgi:tetratricopeptide (TPR) repeat protein
VQDSPLESGHQGSELSTVQDNVSSQADLDIAMPETGSLESCDQWPFSWSTVDIPGSPGLSRLFAALELDELSLVPEFALQGTEVDNSQTVSITELSDLFNEKNKELVYDVDEARKLPRHNATYDYRKCKRGQILRRDLDQVFMGWSESPLMRELYPFPISAIRNTSSFSFPRRDTTAFLEYDEARLIDSLHKLEVSLMPNNRRIIATKQALGQAYLSQNKLEEALDIFYQAYQQKLRIWGSTHLESLETRLDIARVFLRQSRYQPGLDFVEDIISEIQGILSPEHEFAEEAAMTKAYFLVNLGNDEEAERIYRQSLQLRLNNHGPKDRRTLEAMRMLGVVLAKGNHTRSSEAEKLLRATVQIYKETSDSPEAAMCQASGDLGWLQWTLTLDVDSYQVGQAALLRFESYLGPRHPAVLKIRLGLGWNLYGEGKFEESEREFRFLLALHSQSGSQSKLELQFILNGLAHSLWKLSRFEEAFLCIGRVIRGFREIFGPEDTGSSPACDRLGYSYEVQGRSEDAVELYWQMIKMLQGGGFSDHPAIAKLTMRIERLTSAQTRNFYY